MFNFSNCRLALLVALLLPSLSLAQAPPLPDQTTVDNTQQVTVYDSTLPVRERNRRITVGLLRSGLPATIESGECVQGNSAGTALVFATCGASGASTFLDLTDVAAAAIVDGQCVAGNSAGMLVFQACGTGSVSSLTGLSDTPATFGTVGQVLAVTSGLNAVEWVDQAMGPRGLTGATGPTGGMGATGPAGAAGAAA